MDGLNAAKVSKSPEICVWILEDRFNVCGLLFFFFCTSLMFSVVLGWCASCNWSNLFFSNHLILHWFEQPSLSHGTTNNFI